jgi:hypothetical protein
MPHLARVYPFTMIRTLSDLSPKWVSRAIGFDVTDCKATRIGTGQIGDVYRLELQYGSRTRLGPPSVVLKMTSADADSQFLGTVSGIYEREVRFYQEVAPLLTTGPITTALRVERDEKSGEFNILMGDCTPAVAGSDIKGATLEQAKLAVSELGRLHSLVLNHVKLENHPWLKPASSWTEQSKMEDYWRTFYDRYGDRIKPEHKEIGQQFIDNFDAFQAAQQASSVPAGLVHGDYRLDNILFGHDGTQPLTLVDWQTVYWGPILHDLSFFLGLALTPDFRRTYMAELVTIYHTALSVNCPISISIQDCNAGIRMESFTGIRQAITASNVVERTDRGDDLFLTMFERSCELVTDTKALAVLPLTNPPQHLEPKPTDDEMHPFTKEVLHNKNWYFNVVNPEQEVRV